MSDKKTEDVCYGPRFATGPQVFYFERAQVIGLVPLLTHTQTHTHTHRHTHPDGRVEYHVTFFRRREI